LLSRLVDQARNPMNITEIEYIVQCTIDIKASSV